MRMQDSYFGSLDCELGARTCMRVHRNSVRERLLLSTLVSEVVGVSVSHISHPGTEKICLCLKPLFVY